jgi:antitoxin HicB
MDMVFRAKLVSNGEGGFVVTFPDVPEAITEGATRAEALRNAEDALAVALLGRMADDVALPAPAAQGRGLVPVALPTQAAAKLAVYAAFRAAGISKSELARRLGKQEAEARRILDAYHATKLETLEAALRAMGRRFTLSVHAA